MSAIREIKSDTAMLGNREWNGLSNRYPPSASAVEGAIDLID